MEPWIAAAAEQIAARAADELARFVAVSSPSGDVAGAEAALALALELVPPGVRVERPACSSAGHADDLIATLAGSGSGRIVLLGHVDTVHAHEVHRPLERDGEQLVGSGSVDMKGGDVLALGVLRALARRTERFEQVALLLVCDEEWRVGDFVHSDRFAGWDACLCFEGGELSADGEEAVVVRRKAAGTLRVRAHGRSAHSGSAPDSGANALLALADAAQVVGACHDPLGPGHLTAVPTVVRCGEAFNVVPAAGELLCDLRADELETFDAVLAGLPPAVDGVRLEGELMRRWPGMDAPRGRRRCWRRRARASGDRSSARRVVGRATRATWRPGSRSRSTASGRSEGAPTRRPSTSSKPRCGRAPRSRWRSSTPCSAIDRSVREACGEL